LRLKQYRTIEQMCSDAHSITLIRLLQKRYDHVYSVWIHLYYEAHTFQESDNLHRK